MDTTDKNIAAYEKLKQQLEAEHMGKWILLVNGKQVSIYDNFETAAEDAVKKFGAGPYLIRQIGETSVTLPASVVFRLS